MISRYTDLIIIHDLMLEFNMVIGIGNNSAISTSKIIQITAIKKDHDVKCGHEEFFGRNPHSNGDSFSRSSLIFLEIKVVNAMMVADSKMVTVVALVIIVVIIIIYVVFTNFSIGSQVYFSCVR
jgi:hypothetical protein